VVVGDQDADAVVGHLDSPVGLSPSAGQEGGPPAKRATRGTTRPPDLQASLAPRG
jgi:hypothetical protein